MICKVNGMFVHRRLWSCWLVVAVLVTGCAGGGMQEQSADLQPSVNTTGNESDARNRARIHTELAAGYYELGNLGVALEEVRIAEQADSSYAPIYNVAALVYAALKDDRRAEESFNRSLRLVPGDPDANNNYGMFLCQRKREAEGIKYLLTAVQNPLYQNPERSLVNAGVCARRRGDDASAQEFFLRAVALRPNQAQALYQLADLAYVSANYAAAQGYLRRLAQAAQANAEVLWLAVRVERRMGNANGEASYAQQLRKNFPESKEAAALQAGRFE
ncbi:MAG: type IV pilus biogenesis/stability protein PilW [Burkholderiales bacterium]|jgi:type IV pilus assembly protein PilF